MHKPNPHHSPVRSNPSLKRSAVVDRLIQALYCFDGSKYYGNKKQTQEVLREYPSLNYFGFELFEERARQWKGELNQEKYDSELKNLQQKLFDNIEEVEHVINLLQSIEKIKTFNERHSSYGFKHWAEKTAPKRYISNVSFIVGAILSGFKLKIDKSNAYFNISEMSFKQVVKESTKTARH